MKYTNTKALTKRLLVALGLAAIGVGGLSAVADAATCFTCHAPAGSTTDIRPVEATWRNITTGSIKGSHTKHMPTVTALASACTPCHGTAVTSTNHRDGLIQVPTGGYGTGTSFPQSGNPVLSTCNASYCHSDGKATVSYVQSPTWGNTANLTCNGCHTDTTLSTKHAAHINNAAVIGTNLGCVECHSKTVSSNTVVSNATNHLNTFRDYSGVKAGKSSTYSTTTGVCSATYCHSNGKGTAVSMTATNWLASGTAMGCNGCHGTSNSYGSPDYTTGAAGSLTANSHSLHTASGAVSCVGCHNGVVSTDGTAIVTGSTQHLNKTYDVAQGGTVTLGYTPTTKTCATSSCHGSNSVVWGGAVTTNATCTKCHNSGAPSATLTNAAMAPNVGAHQAHVHGTGSYSYSRELSCTECHNSGTTTTFTGHLDGNTQNVVFTNASAARDNNVTAAWTAGTYPNGTCSVYCHGASLKNGDTAGTARTPAWTTALMTGNKTTDCALCHGNPPASVATSHNNKTPTTSCTTCHNHFDATGSFATEANRRLHIDGIVQFSGGSGCNGCHAYQASEWTSTASSTQAGTIGAHATHITYLTTKRATITLTPASDQYASTATSWTGVCGVCHGSTLSNHGTGGNGTINVTLNQAYFFGTTGGSATYNGAPGGAVANKTCSNLSCHYFTSPQWSN